MERILTTEQMRAADRFTIESLGVDEQALVSRAGMAVVDEILSRFKGGRVLVCVGTGNNGKDGVVIADALAVKHGFSVSVLNVKNGIFKLFERKFDIIVDCIFGTGLNRDVDGKFKKAIENINSSGAYVVSCDIPSGLNGDTGKAMGVAVKADLTVAIQEYKLGHFLNDGIDFCGEVVAKDIGISIWGDDYVKRFNKDSLSLLFKPRKRNTHKGSFGKCAIIGGSKNFTGSVLLTANALCAFKMGVGYVNLVIPESMMNLYVGKVPECLLTPIKDNDGAIILDAKTLDSLLEYNSIAVGMGMGNGKGTYDVIDYLIKNFKGNLLIDADGLNALAEYGADILSKTQANIILTPHVKEFERLTKLKKEKIIENTIEIATDYAIRNNVTLLLKNAVSIVTNGNEKFINTSGCSGMAKAGSGDVLSGIVMGLLARVEDFSPCEVAAGGSYLFGLAGEKTRDEQNDFTMTASDIIATISKVINEII